MPVVWGTHDRWRIFVSVALIKDADAAAMAQGKPISNSQLFKALIDTGATGTCITKAAADRVGILPILRPIGNVEAQGVSGTKADYYLFHIGFAIPMLSVPFVVGQSGAQQPQMQNRIYMYNTPIRAAEFECGKGGFDVLLGRDVISTGSLKIAVETKVNVFDMWSCLTDVDSVLH
jgi:hypothetical protein